MSEEKRVKLLLVVLGGVVGSWLLIPLVDRMLFSPARERRTELAKLAGNLESAELADLKLMTAEYDMQDWLNRSLPPDPLDAHRVYQQWITDLADQSGISRVKEIKLERRSTKGDVYTTIPVQVNAEATLDELATFLYRFYKADLLHHIRRMTVRTEDNEGDPRLEVSLTAEGISMANAPQRAWLFPQTILEESVSADADSMTVARPDVFPSDPGFMVRVGNEHLKVNAVIGNNWLVERAVDSTRAADHRAEAKVELVPVHPDEQKRSLDDYKQLIADSPFVKPRPAINYEPKLIATARQVLVRGKDERLSFTIKTGGFDPAQGSAEFAFDGDPLDGMAIDRSSGEITWIPSKTQELGRFEATVAVTQRKNPDLQLTQTVAVIYRDPNTAPKLTLDDRYTVYLGKSLEAKAVVEDDFVTDKGLAWSLADGAPAGMAIDAKTGVLKWSPADDTKPGQSEVTVVVTDNDEPPLKAEKKITVVTEDDPAVFTYLVGVVGNQDDWEGFLHDRSKNQRTVIRKGSDISIAGFDGTVESIERRHIIVASGDDQWRLELGNNLKSMVALPKLPSTTPIPTDTPKPQTTDGFVPTESPNTPAEAPKSPESVPAETPNITKPISQPDTPAQGNGTPAGSDPGGEAVKLPAAANGDEPVKSVVEDLAPPPN